MNTTSNKTSYNTKILEFSKPNFENIKNDEMDH